MSSSIMRDSLAGPSGSRASAFRKHEIASPHWLNFIIALPFRKSIRASSPSCASATSIMARASGSLPPASNNSMSSYLISSKIIQNKKQRQKYRPLFFPRLPIPRRHNTHTQRRLGALRRWGAFVTHPRLRPARHCLKMVNILDEKVKSFDTGFSSK